MTAGKFIIFQTVVLLAVPNADKRDNLKPSPLTPPPPQLNQQSVVLPNQCSCKLLDELVNK